jgi:Rod binding domain-containing protein
MTSIQPVRTQLQPGDLLRHGGHVNTALSARDLDPHLTTRTSLQENELAAFSRASTARKASGGNRHQELLDTAQRWVGQTFFGTLLKQMRNSPFKSELFSGGRAGDAFGAMFDQHLAERMAHSSGRRLAQSIVNQIERAGRHSARSKGGG